MRKKVSEFELGSLLPIGLTLVVAGIGIAYGLNVLGDIKDDFVADDNATSGLGCSSSAMTGCSHETNATLKAIDGIAKLPEKLPLIVTVVVAAVIIGILVRYLMVRSG